MAVPIPFVAPLVSPAFSLVQTGVVSGVKKITRWLSPTILIAGQNSSGKTTLRDYFASGILPDKELLTDETQHFDSRLVDMTCKTGAGIDKTFCAWIRDSRGYFDADPLAKDVQNVRPVFIYFVFDIRRIAEDDRPVAMQPGARGDPMRFYWVQQWAEKFHTRVQGNIQINSKAKRRLCGACVLLNKCDLIDGDEFVRRRGGFETFVRPHFSKLEPLLGFGDTRFDVFYTSLISGKKIPRPENDTSDLPRAIEFMFRMLTNGGRL